MAQKDNKITLTKGEEEVMQLLWELGKGTVNDILERYGQEKPKYTTVATFLKLLEDKGYVGHLQQGKSNMYYPLVEKAEYAGSVASSMLDNFFGGSLMQMVSYFNKERQLSKEEKQELLRLAQQIMDKEE
ncbi:MAG: BlaI/MecI/CopY family transcriptional regulator [Bacteroidales bacterium]|nr:BlaI/MecI/CopY family transcriptional regulator [Bacteroidales bacterium]